MPNFSVQNGQRLYPAADLSEQISLAGKEASGTGNMKFSMNGALTIGTLDGANVEIREEVGAENFFLFGMTADEVRQRQAAGYHPWDYYQGDDELKSVIDLINSGLFSHGDPTLFRPLTDHLINQDPFMVLADYRAYVDCQAQVSTAWADRGQLGPHVHPQCRADGEILLGPGHPRIRGADLARQADAGGALGDDLCPCGNC